MSTSETIWTEGEGNELVIVQGSPARWRRRIGVWWRTMTQLHFSCEVARCKQRLTLRGELAPIRSWVPVLRLVSRKPCDRFQNIAIILVIPDMVKAGYRG